MKEEKGVCELLRRQDDAHLVTLHEIQAKWDLFYTIINAVNALLRVCENNIGALVEASKDTLMNTNMDLSVKYVVFMTNWKRCN